MGRETAKIALPLELLDAPGCPTGGWQAGTEGGRAAIVAAVARLFGPLGTVARTAVEGGRVAAELRVERRASEGAGLLARATRQVEAGKPGPALETLGAAARADPSNPRIHYNLGVLGLQGGDLDAAAESLSRAAGLGYRPAADVAVGLGNVAYRRGDHGRACALFERALALEPGSVVAARNLGAALAELGDYDGAIARFRQSLTADPGAAQTHLALGMALARRGKPIEAAASLRQAVDLAGGRGPLADAAGTALGELGGGGGEPGEGRPPVGASAPPLLGATAALLDDTARLTGHGFAFEARADLPTLAVVQAARGGMADHRILYRPGADSVDHLVAHECGHLVRLWGVPEGERMLPVNGREEQVGALEGLGEELAAMANAGVPLRALSDLFRLAFPGLVAQVTNIPIDLRIERWLRDGYPALRDAQRASLLAQLEVNRGVLKSDVARITPPTIYRASCALNCAFARGVAALYGRPELADPYRETPYWEVAGRLLAALDEQPDDAEGDVAAVDRWAELLGVRGWYRWARLYSLGPAA